MKLLSIENKSINNGILNLSIILCPLMSFIQYRPLVRPTEILFLIFLFFGGWSYLKKDIFLIVTFISFLFISFLIGLFNIDYSPIQYEYWFFSLGNIFISSICLMIFYFTYKYISLFTLIRLWIIGFFLSFSLHVILFFFSNSDIVSRSGFFFEGNFAGLYYVLSFIIFDKFKILTNRRNFLFTLTLLCLFGIFISQSVAAIICLIVYFLLNINIKKLVYIIPLLFLILFNLKYLHKLPFIGKDNIYSTSYSDRITSINQAIDLFKENSFFGSGINTYTFYFSNENSISIVNNIYFEILCEFGIFGSFIFIFLSYLIIFYKFRGVIRLILILMPLLIYLNAFPTIWIPFIFISIVILKKLIINYEQR
jgi:hypothetical protein